MQVTQEMLNKAMKIAVETELIPEHTDLETYLKNWQTMTTILIILEAVMENKTISDKLFEAMKDVCKNTEDTLWISDGETVFERLSTIYLDAGGDKKKLIDEWPQIFT